MSDGVSIPLIPFDPRKIGPKELLAQKTRGLTTFLARHGKVTIGAVVALIVAGLYFGVPTPDVPGWAKVAVVVIVIAAPYGWFFAVRLARGLYNRDAILLSEQNSVNGDQRIIRLAPDRWEDLAVFDHEGKPRDRSYLHEVVINGERAFEVDAYDGDLNMAISSWMAGATNSEIRAHREQVGTIKTDLEEEADKAIEAIIHNPQTVREALKEASMEIVKVAEDVEIPGDRDLSRSLAETLEDSEVSEDLLGDDLKTRDDGTPGAPDVFDRARDMVDGRSGLAASATGGERRDALEGADLSAVAPAAGDRSNGDSDGEEVTHGDE